MNDNVRAIVDFNAQSAVGAPLQQPTTQCLASWHRTLPADTSPGQTFESATTALPASCLKCSCGMNGSAPHMPSPPASRSESATPQFAHSTQQDLVNRLRDDKDRLVSEKERLVAEKDALVNEKRLLADDRERAVKGSEEELNSKNRLWQEYYDAVKTRDEEIGQLKREYTALERQLAVQHKQNRRLARALSEFMEVDEVEADAEESSRRRNERKFENGLGAAPVPRALKQERTSSWIENVRQPGEVMTESRKQMQELFGGAASVIELDDSVPNGEPPAKRAKLSEIAMDDGDNARADAPPPRSQSESIVEGRCSVDH